MYVCKTIKTKYFVGMYICMYWYVCASISLVSGRKAPTREVYFCLRDMNMNCKNRLETKGELGSSYMTAAICLCCNSNISQISHQRRLLINYFVC